MRKRTGKFLSRDEIVALKELFNAGKSKSRSDAEDPERLKRWEKFQLALDEAAVRHGLPQPRGTHVDGDLRHYGLCFVTREVLDLEPEMS